MREIICRAKRTKNKEWIEGYYVKFYDSVDSKENRMIFTINEEEKSSQPYSVDPETVCQYTEVDDKNGTNLFHKDIVSALFIGYGGKKYTRIGVVEYVKGTFCVNCNDSEEYGKNFLGYVNDVEVIGNVFDNPELIQK